MRLAIGISLLFLGCTERIREPKRAHYCIREPHEIICCDEIEDTFDRIDLRKCHFQSGLAAGVGGGEEFLIRNATNVRETWW
jgi:hypothetical protein